MQQYNYIMFEVISIKFQQFQSTIDAHEPIWVHSIIFLLVYTEIKHTVHVALSKLPINQFKPVQQSRQQALSAYCPNIYTVLFHHTVAFFSIHLLRHQREQVEYFGNGIFLMIFKLAARERTRMPMKINHKLCVRMDGTQFLIL